MTEDIEIKQNNQEATVNTIRVKALHARTLFPRSGVFENGNNWGIVSWVVQEVEEGDPKENAYGEITVVGNYTNGIDTSKAYTIIGEEVDNPQYGKQYELKYYSEEADFTREANQREILKELVPINVLPHILKLDNPLEAIINHDTKTLLKVKGIGQTSVYRIYQKYEDKKDYLKAYIALSPYGLTPNFVMKAVNTYKNPDKAIWTVKHKPYDLIKDMSGVGFLKADEVALKIGIKKSDKERIKAFILWYLREEVENGNSWVLAKELNYALYNTLGGPNEIIEYYDKGDKTKNNINQSIQELDDAHLIHIEDNEDKAQRRVYLMRYWNLERKIAYHLKRLQSAHNNFSYSNFEEKIRRAEEKQGFEFTQEQKDGIKLGLDNQVCLIAGSAGVGKSSLVTGILAVLSQYDFAQCALSGKASARLQEVTGKEGKTIHRLLEWNPGTKRFLYNKDNPLPYDIVILDEVSLVGGEIFLKLIEAIKTGAKFYMLGDPGQLEAVGTLNIAHDLLNSDYVPSVELKEVHRQAKKSGILVTAYDVRDQIQVNSNPNFEGIIKRGENEDMILDITDNREDDKNIVLDYYEDLLSGEFVKDDVSNIQVLSPVRERGDCSVFNLNKELQDIANPWHPGMPTMRIYKKNTEGGKETSFDIRINDKVMCIKNNYKLESPMGTPTYIFNGWTGIVKDVEEEYITVHFPLSETGYVVIPKRKVKEHIELGYACTVHKCVTGDSYVFTNKGLKYIRDIDKNSIGDIKIWNGQYFEAPDDFFVNPPQPIREIITRRKYKLKGQYNHKLFSLNENGDMIQKELKDFKEGDCVLISKNNIEAFPQEELLVPEEWKKQPPLDVRTVVYNTPKEIDETMAKFLGFMVADGVISKAGIKLGKKEKDYVEEFARIVEELFGYTGRIVYKSKANMYLLEVGSIFIKNFCNNIEELRPNNKNIPSILFTAPKHIQAAFLSVLFEDGNIHIKHGIFDHIELFCKDKQIILDVQQMLLNFNIISSYKDSFSFMEKYNKTYPHFGLYIYREDAQKFAKEIGFISKLNRDKIQYCFQELRHPSTSNFSYKELTPKTMQLMDKYPWQDFPAKIKNIYRLTKRGENITVNATKKVLDIVSNSLSEDPIYCYLKHIVDNFYIDTIVETKECAPEPTYCFNMPKTHSFIVNGFYSSNCQGSDCPVIIGVIDYSTPPQMLTSQLVYTLLTRAKKKCVLVAQNRALQKAISTDYVSHKRTFLPEMLKFDKDKLEDMGYGKQEWNDSEADEDEDNESEEENEIDNGSIFD